MGGLVRRGATARYIRWGINALKGWIGTAEFPFGIGRARIRGVDASRSGRSDLGGRVV